MSSAKLLQYGVAVRLERRGAQQVRQLLLIRRGRRGQDAGALLGGQPGERLQDRRGAGVLALGEAVPGRPERLLIGLHVAHAALQAGGVHVQKGPHGLVLRVRQRDMTAALRAVIEPIGLDPAIQAVKVRQRRARRFAGLLARPLCPPRLQHGFGQLRGDADDLRRRGWREDERIGEVAEGEIAEPQDEQNDADGVAPPKNVDQHVERDLAPAARGAPWSGDLTHRAGPPGRRCPGRGPRPRRTRGASRPTRVQA